MNIELTKSQLIYNSKLSASSLFLYAMAWIVIQLSPAFGDLRVYNGTDANTLHYWSFDENSTPFADTGGSGNLYNLELNGGVAAAVAYPGFGKALQTVYAVDGDSPFGAGTATVHGANELQGVNGAFTYEGLVYLDVYVNPGVQVMFSTDDNSGGANRIFQIRISNGNLHMISNIDGSRPVVLATLPTTGVHAVTTGVWFHWAISYDGQENTASNTKLYWTRVDSGVTEANLLAATDDNMEEDVNISYNGKIWIGTRLNSSLGQSTPVQGRVDEVRVSNIVRGAGEMIFTSFRKGTIFRIE